MTEHVNTGGPAFPKLRSLNNCKPGEKIATYTSDGMTLRDYFAAKAMQGMLAASENYPTPELANYAYQVADAMLRAREGVK